MRGCPETCAHKIRVRFYQEWRQRLEDEAWENANGKQTEYDEWIRDHPLPLFADYLRQTKNPEPPEEEIA